MDEQDFSEFSVSDFSGSESAVQAFREEMTASMELVDARQVEMLEHIGRLEGYAVFGVVVLLCVFVYKFFRMFV